MYTDQIVPRGHIVALPRGALRLSAVCDCGISLSYSLTLLNSRHLRLISHVTHINRVFKDMSCYKKIHFFMQFLAVVNRFFESIT